MPTTLRNTDILFNDGTTQSSGAGSGFVAGVLAIANGGTASTTAAAARTALGADNASNLTSGTVGTARLATGTANSTTFLRGDQTWATAGGAPANLGDIGSIQVVAVATTSNLLPGGTTAGTNIYWPNTVTGAESNGTFLTEGANTSAATYTSVRPWLIQYSAVIPFTIFGTTTRRNSGNTGYIVPQGHTQGSGTWRILTPVAARATAYSSGYNEHLSFTYMALAVRIS